MIPLYRLLLRLYPASFREEYGAEMCAVYARRRRDTTGLGPLLLLWLDLFVDSTVSASRAHADILRQDLAFAFRTLRVAPGFAVTAIGVAALGVGATTATFSITDHILFRPLTFRDPARLVRLWQAEPGYGRGELSPANYRDWKAMAHSFEDMGGFSSSGYNLGGDDPERIEAFTKEATDDIRATCGDDVAAEAADTLAGLR